jgi:hypothetical protein
MILDLTDFVCLYIFLVFLSWTVIVVNVLYACFNIAAVLSLYFYDHVILTY